MKLGNWSKIGLIIYGLFLPFAAVYADSGSQSIQGIASNLTGTFSALVQLMTAVSYVAGLGFAMASIFKFKAHRDNPTQIPIGAPITLLIIGAALIFLPTLFTVIGTSIFGTGATVGGISGVTNINFSS